MFDEYEEKLRTLLKRAEAPVLGLLGDLVPASARAAIQADLQVLPSAKAYSQRLEQYPALFGVWLAEHVMLGLGQDGNFSLYPHLQKAMGGVEILSPNERELLWRSFRRAMFKLGIQPLPRVSGAHFMMDEYVRQAGVPIAFADDLASRMIQAARHIGLPDEDDQEGLMTWQSALLNRLGQPFSVTARKAVERDTFGYYTRAFLRVHSNGGQATTSDALEVALSKAFSKDGGATAIRRSVIPQLLYRDGVLGLLFAVTTSPTSYHITCGNVGYTVRTDEQGAFRALPPGLHTEVRVQSSDGKRVLSTRLWPDEASNRLLVFNTEGRLRASAQLTQEEPVELAPGRYLALCRFEPTSTDECETVSESPRLTEVALDIHPGVETVLQNGPARVCFVGQNLPSFKLTGPIKGCLEHLEFRYAEITAGVEVPAEWRQAGPQTYELRVVCGEYRKFVLITLDSQGHAECDLSDTIAELKVAAGLRRLVLELARAGDARTLQRQSIFYWIGLTSVSYGLRFAYKQRPQNVVASSCSGIKLGEQQIEPAQEQSRILRMAFDVGGGRLVHLSWNRPGVFVEVEVPGLDGTTSVVQRSLGATETVSLTSPKTIIVSASEPGYITLGNMRTFVDFSQRPSKVFPASFLASRLEPGARTLIYETLSGKATTPLLVLSQPHVAKAVETSRLANVFEIRVTLNGEPTDVAVTGKELSSGDESRAEHELLAGIWHTNELARMQVYSSRGVGGNHVIYILIDIETLKPGVWMLGFGARIGGVWGRLEDPDEGRISVAFAVDGFKKEISGAEVVAEAASLELKDATSRLGRLNEHFRQFWSPVCWEQLSWLGNYFAALVARMREHEAEFITELTDMAMAKAADDVRSGFFAKQSVPASLNCIFTQPRAAYKRVNIKSHPLSAALRAMPEMRGALTQAFGPVLHPCAAMAFKNIAEVMRGMRPKQFDIDKYHQALVETQIENAYRLDDELFLPSAGELLGPLHLAHCWRDLERGYTASHLMQSNRKSAAIALARLLIQKNANFDQTTPPGLRGKSPLMHLSHKSPDAIDDAEQLKQESLDRIANACALFAWYCRMETRKEGALTKFQASLSELRKQVQVQGPVLSDCLAYYLQVAPAMFSYYLLLWELVQTIELDPIVQHV